MALPELTNTMTRTSQYTIFPMRSFTASMRRETDSRKFMAPRSRSEHSRALLSAFSAIAASKSSARSVRRLEREVDEERYEQRARHPPGRMDPAPGRRGCRLGGPGRGSGELRVEGCEEVVRHSPRDPVDQPRADLRELAADARSRGIGQPGSRAFGPERHLRAALAEARRPARSLEGERVGVRRFEIREDELAVEFRLDRAHRGDHDDAILRIGYPLDRLATGDAGLEHLGVVQPAPDFRLRQGDQLFAGHFHEGFRSCMGYTMYRTQGYSNAAPRVK